MRLIAALTILFLPSASVAENLFSQVAEVTAGSITNATCEEFEATFRRLAEVLEGTSGEVLSDEASAIIRIRASVFSGFIDGYAAGKGLSPRAGMQAIAEYCRARPDAVLGQL